MGYPSRFEKQGNSSQIFPSGNRKVCKKVKIFSNPASLPSHRKIQDTLCSREQSLKASGLQITRSAKSFMTFEGHFSRPGFSSNQLRGTFPHIRFDWQMSDCD
jgi:hypothetical protein